MTLIYSVDSSLNSITALKSAAVNAVRALRPTSLWVEKAEALTTLKEIAGLAPDWDGYGAPAMSRAVMSNSLTALHLFISADLVPEVTPNPNGTVSLEWSVEGATAHLQIGDTDFSMYIRPREGVTSYFNGKTINFSAVSRKILAVMDETIRPAERFEPSLTSINYRSRRHYEFA